MARGGGGGGGGGGGMEEKLEIFKKFGAPLKNYMPFQGPPLCILYFLKTPLLYRLKI
jgi:hypothetical protein